MLLESGVHKAITASISTLHFLFPQFFSGVFQDHAQLIWQGHILYLQVQYLKTGTIAENNYDACM